MKTILIFKRLPFNTNTIVKFNSLQIVYSDKALGKKYQQIYDRVHKSLLCFNNEHLEVVLVKKNTSTTVFNKNNTIGTEFTALLLVSKKYIYSGKINKGSQYIMINISSGDKVEIHPYDNDSVLMNINLKEGIEVTYILEYYNFQMLCNGLYKETGYGILKKNYEDIPITLKKELLNSALTYLEDTENINIYTGLYIDDRLFWRYKSVYGHVKTLRLSSKEFYKDGYLYTQNIIEQDYKKEYYFNSDEFFQKEANFIETAKKIINLLSDDFKLKDSYSIRNIIYVDIDTTIDGVKARYNIEITLHDKSFISLMLSYNDSIFYFIRVKQESSTNCTFHLRL